MLVLASVWPLVGFIGAIPACSKSDSAPSKPNPPAVPGAVTEEKSTVPAGIPAPGEPEWSVRVELEKVGQRNVFHFFIQEKHGWAADGLFVELWHRTRDTTGERKDDSRRTPYPCRGVLGFGGTLEQQVVVAPYEFPEVKDFGTSEDWAAAVSSYTNLTAPKP